ncbi:TasA family protein, partial [Methanomethylophilus alvi]|uniref:TasA family protein n=1 Tax=Methanomethylophilus alvi TaxID=1291540 RepID=UPI0037DD74BB
MKTETKAIVASALVVALALTAISGVTYSWFSDSEDATINVTTGTIEVDAKWSDFTLRSANIDGEKTVHIGDRDISFPYTSSKFSSAETASSGSTKISVTAFMNPGDSFEFTISDIVLKNTIKAVFNYGYEIKVVDGPEAIPFVVKHTTTDPEFNVPNITYAGSDTAREFSDNTITVTLPMDCGNEYQGCSYQMEFYIVAVQSNSPDANITQSNSGAAVHDVTAGDNVVAVSPAEGVFDSATIQFNSGSSDGKIVVKTVDSTTEGITVSDGNAILAGVDVTTGGSEHALQGTNVRITFVIDGILPGNSISIYHDGAAITPS